MKRIYTVCMVAMLMTALFSCGNKSQQSSDKKEINPIWGMWLQQTPATDVKQEIMFNEDFTGFVFVADTLQYCLQWSQDNNLNVVYKSPAGDVLSDKESKYDVTLNGDTLVLTINEVSDSLNEKRCYLRVRM